MSKLLFFLFIAVVPTICEAVGLGMVLEPQEVIKTKKFNGAVLQLKVEGVGDFHHIIEVIGPKSRYKIWKKEQILGMWIKSKHFVTKKIPSYQFITTDLDEVEISKAAKSLSIDLYGKRLSFMEQENYSTNELHEVVAALFRSQKDLMYYVSNFNQKKISENNIISIPMVSSILVGDYEVKLYLLDKNYKKTDTRVLQFSVIKDELYYKLEKFSQRYPIVYVVFSIIVTILIGLIANTILRR